MTLKTLLQEYEKMIDARKKILSEKRVLDTHIQNIKGEIMSTMKRKGLKNVVYNDMIISTDVMKKKGNRTKKEYEKQLQKYLEHDLNLSDATRIITNINNMRKTDEEKEIESLKLVKMKKKKRPKY